MKMFTAAASMGFSLSGGRLCVSAGAEPVQRNMPYDRSGVRHGTGEFLTFADSDDLLLPDAYARGGRHDRALGGQLDPVDVAGQDRTVIERLCVLEPTQRDQRLDDTVAVAGCDHDVGLRGRDHALDRDVVAGLRPTQG